jgi:hypothetical protein
LQNKKVQIIQNWKQQEGCQIFLDASGKSIPNGHKKYIPNGHKMDQMAVKSIPNDHT